MGGGVRRLLMGKNKAGMRMGGRMGMKIWGRVLMGG